MIIYIDRTIGEHCKKYGLTQEEELFFDQLATAHQHGECLLCGDIYALDLLRQRLSGPHARLYQNVYSRYSEIKSIIGYVEFVLVITKAQNPVIPKFIEGKQRIIPLDEALKLNISSKCYLVGENLNDCLFYTIIAKRYLHKLPIRNIQINFCNENGGGDTTNLVFKKCVIDDNRPTLCLADSDKKHGTSQEYPNEPARGNTILKIEKVYEDLSDSILSSICEVYCLSVHEVENLIPICVLDHLCNSGTPEMAECIAFLKLLLSSNLAEAILFYDFKEGDKKIKDPPAMAYWIELLDQVPRTSVPSLCCTKLLEKSINALNGREERINDFAINMTLDSYLLPYWESIGSKVFSWGCCNLPSST